MILALLLSLISAGAGQIYNGQYLKGAVFAGLFILGRSVLLPLLIRLFNFKDDINFLKLIYVFNIIYPLLTLAAAVDAAYFAFNTAHTLTQAALGVLAAVIFASAYRALRSGFIAAALSGRQNAAKYIFAARNRNNGI
ncbi:MAG: hypothetical protein LBR90_04030 [Elusimicrobiota bacterium]|jgi:TM2 domain-containing membrane protein YozV|nr:hypothetical protein [Elusimicrobiota bacterium]